MKCQLRMHFVASAVLLTVATTSCCMCLAAAEPGAFEATRIVSAGGDARPIVVAQYNPCPNGRCK
jgi:hypothetical protein